MLRDMCGAYPSLHSLSSDISRAGVLMHSPIGFVCVGVVGSVGVFGVIGVSGCCCCCVRALEVVVSVGGVGGSVLTDVVDGIVDVVNVGPFAKFLLFLVLNRPLAMCLSFAMFTPLIVSGGRGA